LVVSLLGGAAAVLPLRQCEDCAMRAVVLACTSRWSKLSLHTKAGLGGQKSGLE
jgi:hypothetical protein